jgi:ATP-dependent protease Clp ATPase subunit
MRTSRRLLVVALATLGACGGPLTSGDTTLAETLIDMSDALIAVRDETALLQAQVDSLREHVARQDTILRRLASVAGMPLPGP